MQNTSKICFAVIIALTLSACASNPPAPHQGIQSAEYLQPNNHGQRGHEPLIYTTSVDWNQYKYFILEPVTIYRGADNTFVKVTEDRKAELAGYMQTQFQQKLQQRYTKTAVPGADTLRIKITLTGAKATTTFLGTATKFDLGGGPYNLVQSARGREGLFGGSVSYAVEIFDSNSKKLLKAYVDKQYPNAMNVKASVGALTASRAGIDKGAENLLKGMD